jgi:hypothetical protein
LQLSQLSSQPASQLSPRGWAILLAAVLIAGATFSEIRPIGDIDVFWNLKIGQLTLQAGGPLSSDPLTFTVKDEAWIQHELGAQLILAGVDWLGGWWALRLFRAALLGATLVLLLLLFLRVCDQPLAVLAGLTAAWVFLLPFTEIRPHLVGWVLLAAGCWWFLTAPPPWRAWRYGAFAFWLVTWVNIHSSALIVPTLCGLQLCDQALRSVLRRRWEWGVLVHWTRLTALAAGAVLLQPAGLALIAYSRQTLALNQQMSEEWLSLFRADVWVTNPQLPVLVLILAALAIVASRRALRREPGEGNFPGALPALFVLGLAMITRRMLFLGFLPLLLVARELGALPWLSIREGITRLRRRILITLAAILAVVGVLHSFHPGERPWDAGPFEPGEFPVEAVSFLGEVGLQGRMYNIDDWGGFLAYHLHPAYRTLIDGRWLEAGQQVLRDSIDIVTRVGDLEGLLDRYRIDFAVQPTEMYFLAPSLDPDRWLLAYVDPTAVVLLRRTAELPENVQRVCGFYRQHPELAGRAAWSSLPRAIDSSGLPPGVLPACPDRDGVSR